jgi:hypothetical protein
MGAVTGIWRLRAAVLSLLGVVVVHHGRYLLAPREHDHELAEVHGYLTWLMPAAGALLFLAVVQLVVSMRRSSDGAAPDLPPGRVLWAAGTATLLCLLAVQESAEWVLVHGSLPTPAKLVEHGGWAVLVLTVVVGGLLALLLKGAAGVVRWALRRRARRRHTPIAPAAPKAPRLAAPASVLARFLAGRAPPVSPC